MLVIEMRPYGTIAGANKVKPTARIGLDGYTSLTEAVEAVVAGTPATIVLMETVNEDVAIPAGKEVTLDLNGNSVTNVSGAAFSVAGALTIEDLLGGGEVVATGANKAVSVANGGSVVIQGGTFTGGLAAAEGGTVAVSGGTFDEAVPEAFCAFGYIPKTTTTVMGEQEVTTYGIERGWKITFADEDTTVLLQTNVAANVAPVYTGVAPTKAADAQYTYGFAGWTNLVTETGYGLESALPGATTNATYTAFFTNTVNQYAVAFEWHDGATTNEYDYGTAAADVVVPRDPASYVENGTIYTFTGWSAAVADVTGAAIYTAQYSSATAVAEVLDITNDGATTNSVGTFASLRAALSDAPAGSTIVLLADDSVSFSATDPEIGVNKAITIDGDGHTLYGLDDYAGGSGDHDIYVSGSGDVTIKNITLAEFGGAVPVTGRTYPIWTGSAYSGTLTLDNVTVTNFNRTAFNLNGGTVVVKNCTIAGDMTKGFPGGVFQEGIGVYNADVTVENTTITGAGSTYEKEDSQIAACIQLGNPNGATPGTGSITVKSGTFAGQYGIIVASNATDAVTVQNGTFAGALLVEEGEGGSIAVSGGTFDAPVPAEFAADGYAPTTVADANGKYTVTTACKVFFVVDDASTTNLVAKGESVAQPTDPVKAGFAFTGWTLDGAAYDFSAAVTNDIELVANFQADQIDPVDPGEGLSDEEIEGGAVPAGIVTDEDSGETAFVVCFHGHAGVTYTLQGSTSLDPADWTSDALVVGDPFACTKDGQLVRLEFPMDANAPSAMFFKIGASRTQAAGE